MNQGEHKNGGGETPGRRDTMDRMRRQLIERGNDSKYADRVVRDCARRADRLAERKD